MRVIVTGGTGLIGTVLVPRLIEAGHDVIVLTRQPAVKAAVDGVQFIGWDARTPQGWDHLINADTAIINLAGEPVANWRWTAAHKQRVLDSRIQTSEAVLNAIQAAEEKPAVLLQASAVGYYGSRGDETLAEASLPGAGWRAQVCVDWEAVTDPVDVLGVRRCLLRIGIVLDRRSGALPPLLLAARMLGARLADGRQWIPWIHNADVAGAILHLLHDAAISGPVNLVAPYPVTNADFLSAIGQRLGTPTVIPVPGWGLRVALGEMATTVLDSQRVYPPLLLEHGYDFAFPTLESALADLV